MPCLSFISIRRRRVFVTTIAFAFALLVLLVLTPSSFAAPGGESPWEQMTERFKDIVVGSAEDLYIVGLLVAAGMAVVIWRSVPKFLAVLLIFAMFAPIVMTSGKVKNTLTSMGGSIWPDSGAGGGSGNSTGGSSGP